MNYTRGKDLQFAIKDKKTGKTGYMDADTFSVHIASLVHECLLDIIKEVKK